MMTLLPFESLDRWPAIQWKPHNVGTPAGE